MDGVEVFRSWRRVCPETVAVRPCADELKGCGLFAAQAVAADALLFDEAPVPGTAHLLFDEPGAAGHCAHCTLRLRGRDSEPPCHRGCGVVYCSAACRAEAWRVHHEILCGARTERWRAFEDHAQSCGNEYYIVAARMFTSLRGVEVDASDETEASVWSRLPWSTYHAPAWWSTMRRPVYSDSDEDEDEAEETEAAEGVDAASAGSSVRSGSRAGSTASTPPSERFQDQIYEQTEETVEMLRRILVEAGLGGTAASGWLTTESFGRLIGLLRVNVLSVRAGAELSQAQRDERDAVDHNALKGMALYALQSALNHSPLPNCYMASKLDEPHRCIIYVSRDVAAGEELCIDYMAGAPHSLEERVQILMSQYGIRRLCPPEPPAIDNPG